MFTGIVTTVGEIQGIRRSGACDRLSVLAPSLAKDIRLGDSVCVAGVCLTATVLHADGFEVDVGPETAKRTKVGTFKKGSPVNLEPALRMGDRLGGHLVLGHVDGVGKVLGISSTREAAELRIWYDGPEQELIVTKGSVTVDGVSLTVAQKGAREFSLSLIPYTLKSTTLAELSSGAMVNIEVDVIGRYVAALMGKSRSIEQLLGEAWGAKS